MPGETGFLYREDSTYIPFWLALLHHLAAAQNPADLYLHLFDFHGVYHRTGRWPSLREAASDAGYRFIPAYQGFRAAGPHSHIRRKLAETSVFFPDGQILLDGRLLDLPSAAAVQAKWPDVPLEVPHSICLLRK